MTIGRPPGSTDHGARPRKEERKSRSSTKAYRYEVGVASKAWCYVCGSEHRWGEPCEDRR